MLRSLFPKAMTESRLSQTFSGGLEREYTEYLYRVLLRRIPLIGWSGLVIFLGYSVFDLLFMQPELSSLSVGLRLMVICPSLLGMLLLVRRRPQWSRFLTSYCAAYAISSLAVALIVVLSRFLDTFLPYQGLLLMLLFGYFLLGLPTPLVSAISIAISIFYLVIEGWLTPDLTDFAYQVLFFATANAMGICGSYIHERGLRASFLSHRKLARNGEQLLEENARKTLLLASLSHDLKQPLLAMSLVLEQMDSNGSDGRLIRGLQGSLDHLQNLTRAMLRAASREDGIIQPRPRSMDLSQLLQTLLSELRPRYQHQSIALRCEVESSVRIHSDPLLLGRIIRNLLDNALRHSGASTVVVSAEETGEFTQLIIADDGRGLPGQAKERLLGDFIAPLETTLTGGLGLTIVNQLSAMLSIPLTAESGVDESGVDGGTRITLALPTSESLSRPLLEVAVLSLARTPMTEIAQLLEGWGVRVIACLAEDAAHEFWRRRPSPQQVNVVCLPNGNPDSQGKPARYAPHPSHSEQSIYILPDTDSDLDGEAIGKDAISLLFYPLRPAQLRLVLRDFCQRSNLRFSPVQSR